jgi:hypothetical protein
MYFKHWRRPSEVPDEESEGARAGDVSGCRLGASPSSAGDGTGGRPGVDDERDRDHSSSLNSLDD